MEQTFMKQKDTFIAVPVNLLTSNLSLEAKGLYAIILAHNNMPYFELSRDYLMQRYGKKIEGALNELAKKGYIITHELKSETMQETIIRYEVLYAPLKSVVSEVKNTTSNNLKQQEEAKESQNEANKQTISKTKRTNIVKAYQ